METWPGFLMSNPQNITGNQNQFEELIENTTNLLATKAATGNGKKYATTAVEFRSFKTLYGLEQCTPDLTDDSCFRCLNNAIGMLQIRQGARVLLPSCNIRYETYPFFQGADNLLSPPPPLPPPMATANPPSIVLPKDGNKKVSSTVIIAIVTPIATIAVALLILGICLIKRKAKKVRSNVVDHTTTGEDFTTTESIQYDLDMLQSATNNFSDQNKLGEGGFGAVYKGTLTNGQKIAVKKLATRSSQGVREFKNEALLVAKLQHRNLVKLLGFCLAGEEKLLVYEYVLNKSLDCFLFDPEKQGQLDWRMRYNIIQGIARGMLYLHQDSRLTIIHRDLKASNILLDRNMNPKIADFGIARIFGVDQTQENTSRIVGTYGYMAPEYAMQGQFSTKSDVYSFGVLVLEIISGKRNTSFYQSDDGEDLISYAWKQWKERSPMNLADPNIRHSCSNNELMRCIHLGLLCVQESINDRPTMATIVLTLDSNSVTLPVPEQPIFTVKSRSVSSFPKETGSDEQSSNKSAPWSVNDVSITEPEPR